MSSCKKDKCKDVKCLNGGVCIDGDCVCPGAFTGTNCETPVDLCAGVTCLNGGTCLNGDCNCATGYEGVNCETEMRSKFLLVDSGIAIWDLQGIIVDTFTVPIKILPATGISTVKIQGLGCDSTVVYANVFSTNQLVILDYPGYHQVVCNDNSWISNGTVTITNNKLTISYIYHAWHDPSSSFWPWDVTIVIDL